jgi:hypothetical protein
VSGAFQKSEEEEKPSRLCAAPADPPAQTAARSSARPNLRSGQQRGVFARDDLSLAKACGGRRACAFCGAPASRNGALIFLWRCDEALLRRGVATYWRDGLASLSREGAAPAWP